MTNSCTPPLVGCSVGPACCASGGCPQLTSTPSVARPPTRLGPKRAPLFLWRRTWACSSCRQTSRAPGHMAVDLWLDRGKSLLMLFALTLTYALTVDVQQCHFSDILPCPFLQVY
ncbi:hypothetical protein P691DRAFT_115919 [Macrolepiota fuliginosa MF-IS2]|uniref:Uncharacterized protein n=1 Tax=Macrolepiota fuliginosa MF-IS2 TaxID=1400762 RepID=A0A9P5WZZ4_9AGAR|nr:hypothetical protein P691DRAFT_115919 [Macrolepiota fuliginosa MF-IS2]